MRDREREANKWRTRRNKEPNKEKGEKKYVDVIRASIQKQKMKDECTSIKENEGLEKNEEAGWRLHVFI